MTIRVANAPCSWGVLEFGVPTESPPAQVLDEMAAAGYAGTELGDWGFLPTAPDALASEVARRRLALVGAFVPVALAREAAIDEGLARAVRTAQLLADATSGSSKELPHDGGMAIDARRAEGLPYGKHDRRAPRDRRRDSDRRHGVIPVAQPFRAASDAVVGQPFRAAVPVLVLSDDNATVPHRTERAGRIRDEDGLTPAGWDGFAARAERIARAVLDATGLRTVFHHHCAGYVETPREIDALMSRTSPSLLGLCLDTGHLTFGGGDPVSAIAAYGDRIWHVHFKDCDAAVARAARDHGWDYHAAVRHGIFCELGRGVVPFAAVRDALAARRYDGWIVVEQDVLPGLGTPAESARRNRDFLRGLGL